MTTNAEVLAAEEALERAKVARDEANATLKAAVQAEYDANATLKAAMQAMYDVNATLKAAMQAMYDVNATLRAAKVRADDHLPRAYSCLPICGVGTLRHAVVIVRRTAKTITTRFPGEAGEQQWRKDKDGKWRQWPDRGSTRWLEIAE